MTIFLYKHFMLSALAKFSTALFTYAIIAVSLHGHEVKITEQTFIEHDHCGGQCGENADPCLLVHKTKREKSQLSPSLFNIQYKKTYVRIYLQQEKLYSIKTHFRSGLSPPKS